MDLAAETRIVGHDVEAAALAAQVADDRLAAALEHALDAADQLAGTLAAAAGKNAHDDAVAGQRDAAILGENLHRRIARSAGPAVGRLGHDKRRPAGAELDAADELVLRQTKRGRGRR